MFQFSDYGLSVDVVLLGAIAAILILLILCLVLIGKNSSLSFVLTLLTKENDGFIMNSMHSNKEGCYIYIKEVKSGEVFVTLSEEERQSLEQAMTAE